MKLLTKEMVRGFGMDPERVLVKDAISEAHRGLVSSDPMESEAEVLWSVLKAKMLLEMKGRWLRFKLDMWKRAVSLP